MIGDDFLLEFKHGMFFLQKNFMSSSFPVTGARVCLYADGTEVTEEIFQTPEENFACIWHTNKYLFHNAFSTGWMHQNSVCEKKNVCVKIDCSGVSWIISKLNSPGYTACLDCCFVRFKI